MRIWTTNIKTLEARKGIGQPIQVQCLKNLRIKN